jgi:leucyl/phenylalanyl-tRNA--protein transferase
MLTILDPNHPEQIFPSAKSALIEPDGLLAIGGCLSSKRIINAYKQGIFPWFNADSPILWWSPDPRMILFPKQLNISRSLRKTIRRQLFSVTVDKAFSKVISACAAPREKESGTWICQEMKQAYIELYRQGIAHSVEIWLKNELVGGLYGIALGQVFFGESMFHRQTDTSKIAFVALVEMLSEWDYKLIDCQVQTTHLQSLGAEEIARDEFVQLLAHYCESSPSPGSWKAY